MNEEIRANSEAPSNPEDAKVEIAKTVSKEPLSNEDAKRMVSEMFEEYQDRLTRMIEVRLQPELRSRVDSCDILQESFMEAYRQLKTGVSAPKGSPLVWLRLIVGQQIVANYRKHCLTQKRNVAKEFSLSAGRTQTDTTSTSIYLVGKLTSPSLAARRHEMAIKIRDCLEQLSEPDREILSLRHFEQLTNRETAEELNLSPNAASVMYMRALKKFRVILERENLDELLQN